MELVLVVLVDVLVEVVVLVLELVEVVDVLVVVVLVLVLVVEVEVLELVEVVVDELVLVVLVDVLVEVEVVVPKLVSKGQYACNPDSVPTNSVLLLFAICVTVRIVFHTLTSSNFPSRKFDGVPLVLMAPRLTRAAVLAREVAVVD